jgi:hypothetical protein
VSIGVLAEEKEEEEEEEEVFVEVAVPSATEPFTESATFTAKKLKWHLQVDLKDGQYMPALMYDKDNKKTCKVFAYLSGEPCKETTASFKEAKKKDSGSYFGAFIPITEKNNYATADGKFQYSLTFIGKPFNRFEEAEQQAQP